jgi:hypothetical protein
MHADAQRHNDAKKKRTNNSNIRDFSGSLQSTPLTRDLAPRSKIMRGRKSWVNYRIFMLHVELVDTTNKRFLLDTTNKGFLLMLTMMNFRRADLLGLRQEIVLPRMILKLEEGKREDSKLAKVRGEKHIGKE